MYDFFSSPRNTILLGPMGLGQDEFLRKVRESFLDGAEEHPDYLCRTEKLGIEDLREIVDFAEQYPVAATKRIIVLSLDYMTKTDTENVLLKTIEECPTALFLCLASDETHVLPTIRSRMMTVWFRPLSYQAFSERVTAGEDGKLLFLLTGGCPGQVPDYEEELPLYRKIASDLGDRKTFSLLLDDLGLMKEKSDGFFQTHSEKQLSGLLRLFRGICYSGFLRECGMSGLGFGIRGVSRDGLYQAYRRLSRIDRIATTEDFFDLIVELCEVN